MLESGDLVLLMTDGILEARLLERQIFSGPSVRSRWFASIAVKSRASSSNIIRQASLFCRHVQLDDMTAVVIKVE